MRTVLVRTRSAIRAFYADETLSWGAISRDLIIVDVDPIVPTCCTTRHSLARSPQRWL